MNKHYTKMNEAFHLLHLESFWQLSFLLEAFLISADGCLEVLLYGLMHIPSFTLMEVAGQNVARSFKEDLLNLFELGETNDLSQSRV
jgi:hypothetical protein